MGLNNQIEQIRTEWNESTGSFFLPTGLNPIYIKRRFRAGQSDCVFPVFDSYPPIHISKKHSYWGAPGEYLQIGLIITEALPEFPKFCPVCISIVPRKDWISRQKHWLSDTVTHRYNNKSDEKMKHDEVVSAVKLEDRVKIAEQQNGYFYADNSFLVMENLSLLPFKIWRGRE